MGELQQASFPHDCFNDSDSSLGLNGNLIMKRTQKKQLRQVQIIRFVLPFILFFIVAIYETWEHVLVKGEFYFDFHLTSEVLFFGVMGPTAVYISLTYIVSLLKSQVVISEELERLNQTLEEKVLTRTNELKERNRELAAANEELKKVDQLKSDFVSLVSHELRGPLTTLNGGIELALQNTENIPPESRRIFEVMEHESKRLTKFVQTILDVSRLDAGKLIVNPSPVAVSPLLERAIAVIFAGDERVVDLNDPGNLFPVWADEIYLEKVVHNLLNNANKYSPAEKPILITNKTVNGNIEISVIDHGPGIPADMQARIFERFQRLEDGERISTKGWGLGLYFAKALTETQGGKLTVQSPVHDSQENPGTAFTLTFPLADEVPDDA